ncbi:hypothetical protein B0A49_02583 [Cryomyces minteri]|uniref:Uncharacterized protein n=1 Tax=Cryomyces minteri TaxID=331657 RepID=A0A4U0XJQ7_9PEZI|nr:hypothetical protein B0A49_02583 [Cryomyces minteri]
MDAIVNTIDYFNFRVSRSPWRLFEFCDLWIMPPFLRRRCQAMLTAQWTHRLPFLQSITPAERAAALILWTLGQIEDLEESKFTIIDFCSGGGGPVPTIERLVNQERASQGEKPIPFLLSDIHPHLDAWITASSRSAHLSFVPQSVDATHPPVSVTSRTATFNNPAEAYTSDTRVFRLYCLAFHHFPDALARKTLASTLATSDGFAIIELQDRHVFSLALMALDLLLVFFVSPLWFWGDWLRLLFTNIVPLLPVIQAFDGAKEEHSAHTISQRIRTLKKIPPELIPLGIVLAVAVGAAFWSLGRKLWVDKSLRLERTRGHNQAEGKP